MPTYDFQCRACVKFFDARMSMSEYSTGERPSCPECGDAKPARTFSATVNVIKAGRPDVSSHVAGIKDSVSGSCGGGGSCGCACG